MGPQSLEYLLSGHLQEKFTDLSYRDLRNGNQEGAFIFYD